MQVNISYMDGMGTTYVLYIILGTNHGFYRNTDTPEATDAFKRKIMLVLGCLRNLVNG